MPRNIPNRFYRGLARPNAPEPVALERIVLRLQAESIAKDYGRFAIFISEDRERCVLMDAGEIEKLAIVELPDSRYETGCLTILADADKVLPVATALVAWAKGEPMETKQRPGHLTRIIRREARRVLP